MATIQKSNLKTVNPAAAQAQEIDSQIAALQNRRANIQAPSPINRDFVAGHAYECVTSNTSQFVVGSIYMGVRTGKISEMDPATGLVSERARVFNITKSTFVDVGTWCAKPTKKVS